ncbi:MAG: hypothetical protein K5886_00965 [Lachnospiraceae bacterium]|nr:hypothetical protein [Lachnospiraceae bacterium]
MLGKLIKYDLNATWKIMVVLDAVIIFLGILTGTVLHAVPSVEDSIGLGLMMFSFIGLFYIGIIAASVITIIFLVMRFYRNLYTAEGYLTFTLPVKTDLIMHSKVITGAMWMFLSYICIITAFIISGAGLISGAGASADELAAALREFYSVLGFPDPGFAAVLIFTFIVTPFVTVVSMYFCVSVGQLWQNHKIIGTILCIIGLYIVNQIIAQGIMFGSGFWKLLTLEAGDIDAMFGSMYKRILLSMSIMNLIEGIIFYVVNIIITRKKVNLD